MNVPMPYMPTYRRLGCPGVPPPRVPAPLQWPLPLLLEKFAEYRDQLVREAADLVQAETGLVSSVNGRTGAVELAAADIGLGDVVNTGDSDTPAENGTQKFTTGGAYAALARKADKSTTLAGYGIADAYTRAEADEAIAGAISAVKDSAPEAFDTLKEIADWIRDDRSGAAAMAAQISSHTSQLSQLSQDKVDKVAGKGLSTNDYTAAEKEKLGGVEAGAKDNVVEAASASAFPQQGAAGKIYVAKDENKTYRWDGSQYVQIGGSDIDVVPPSTDPADAGKAADAKATGDALAAKLSKAEAKAGFTEWELSGNTQGYHDELHVVWGTSDDVTGWVVIDEYGGVYGNPKGNAQSTNLTWTRDVDADDDYAATRTRLPTMADIPAASTAAPQMDGTASTGVSAAFARGDHVHPSDTSKASTNDVALTPVYSQVFGKWQFSDGLSHAVLGPYRDYDDSWVYKLDSDDGPASDAFSTESEALLATNLTFYSLEDVNATRTSTSVVSGYTLGDQTTKPLQPQGDYAPATNILKTALASDVQASLGKADTAVQPAALAGKLDSSSATPAFSDDSTVNYAPGAHVTYNGKLYVCATATTGGTWVAANWTATDMTTPDATLDITSDGRLHVVAANNAELWSQGYNLSSASSTTLSCDKGNLLTFAATTATAFSDSTDYAIGDLVVYDGRVYKFTAAHAAGAWVGTDAEIASQALAFPTAATGKVGDFGLDVDNTANAGVSMSASLTGLDSTFSVVVPKGENLADMLTFAGGELAVLYFTLTAFRVNNLPTWQVLKQVVENGGAQS